MIQSYGNLECEGKMKFVKNDLSAELDNIEIEIFSDLHLGSKRCDYKAIKEG